MSLRYHLQAADQQDSLTQSSLRLAFLGNCVDQSHPFVDSEWLSMSIMHAVELQLAAHVHC